MNKCPALQTLANGQCKYIGAIKLTMLFSFESDIAMMVIP